MISIVIYQKIKNKLFESAGWCSNIKHSDFIQSCSPPTLPSFLRIALKAEEQERFPALLLNNP